MMLLGLVLHSAVNYVVFPLGPAWPYKDPATSTVFDILVFVIHLFRMPVFFVAAGFFAAMLMERDGARGILRQSCEASADPAGALLAGPDHRDRRGLRLHDWSRGGARWT